MPANQQLNAYQQGGSGGAPNIPEPGNPTYTEAWALIECARRMAGVIEYGNLENYDDKKKLRDALRLNWRLWTIFQAELTVEQEHNVPDDLRIDMLTLCKFVDKHTLETMKEPTPEKVVVLIDLNRNIAQGLLASLEGPAEETTETEAPAEPGSVSADA